jgi:hypothetical protein
MQVDTQFIKNERCMHSRGSVNIYYDRQKKVGRTRKGWTDQHRLRRKKLGMGYKLLLLWIMMMIMMV